MGHLSERVCDSLPHWLVSQLAVQAEATARNAISPFTFVAFSRVEHAVAPRQVPGEDALIAEQAGLHSAKPG
jgi:hypothetical protein